MKVHTVRVCMIHTIIDARDESVTLHSATVLCSPEASPGTTTILRGASVFFFKLSFSCNPQLGYLQRHINIKSTRVTIVCKR